MNVSTTEIIQFKFEWTAINLKQFLTNAADSEKSGRIFRGLTGGEEGFENVLKKIFRD